jgi:hypothetical protein
VKSFALGALGSTIAVGLGAGLIWLALLERTHLMIRGRSGETYEIVSVSRDRGISTLLRDSTYNHREAVVVVYRSRQRDLDSEQAFTEAQQVTEIVPSEAIHPDDSLIVVQATRPIGPSWSPVVKGRWHFFVRADGDWQEIIP